MVVVGVGWERAHEGGREGGRKAGRKAGRAVGQCLRILSLSPTHRLNLRTL